MRMFLKTLDNLNRGRFKENCRFMWRANSNQRAFLAVSSDGMPVCRIVIGRYSDSVPFGPARVGDLASGTTGTTYGRREFVKVTPNSIQHDGVRSYGIHAELQGRQEVIVCWHSRMNGRNRMRTVRLPRIWPEALVLSWGIHQNLPPKLQLAARIGKLEVDRQEVGVGPNGTGFVLLQIHLNWMSQLWWLEKSVWRNGSCIEDWPSEDKAGEYQFSWFQAPAVPCSFITNTVLHRREILCTQQRNEQHTANGYSYHCKCHFLVFRILETTFSLWISQQGSKFDRRKRRFAVERGFSGPYSKVLITNCGLIKWMKLPQNTYFHFVREDKIVRENCVNWCF